MSTFFNKNDLSATWDVIVVGGGHAGCEAALAAARMGCETLLVTQSILHLGSMPCNPSIGGLAKSHLVFELDALGGEMGRNTDLTGFQFRVLNSSRGPAVRANRVQCDKPAYTQRMIATIVMQDHLSCLEDECTGIIKDEKDPAAPCEGITTMKNGEVFSKTVVITSGTALKGVIYIGKEAQVSGGGGRPGCNRLSENLRKNGFELKRLKTGTPPRLDVSSIHWNAFENQSSETPTPVFSWTGKELLEHSVCSTWNNLIGNNRKWNGFFRQYGQIFDKPYTVYGYHNSEDNPIFLKGEELQDDFYHCSTWNNEKRAKQGLICSTWNSDKENPKKCSTWNSLPDEEQEGPWENALLPWEPFSLKKIVSTGHTTEKTAQIVRDHLKDSALYGGPISGTGVRYCPSFEDKIVKFTKKTEHHVILEPESRLSPAVYPNGLSNSLPREIQVKMVHSVPGLEDAKFLAWGYAIEYDAIDARELNHRLESKRIENLFFAGQTNGTTGYEEAAAQGLIAGINAALRVKGKNPLELRRDQAYIGVMIDDLVTKGTDEPYRMFTSRAERRLHLRQDNARFRLYEQASYVGLADKEFLEESDSIMKEYQREIVRLDHEGRDAMGEGANGRSMMHPGANYEKMPFANHNLSKTAIQQIEFHYHYAGYLHQEEMQIQKMKRN